MSGPALLTPATADAVADALRHAADARQSIVIRGAGGALLVDERRSVLRGIWSETTHAIASLRDDPTSADEEQATRVDADDPGLSATPSFDVDEDVAAKIGVVEASTTVLAADT